MDIKKMEFHPYIDSIPKYRIIYGNRFASRWKQRNVLLHKILCIYIGKIRYMDMIDYIRTNFDLYHLMKDCGYSSKMIRWAINRLGREWNQSFGGTWYKKKGRD